MISAGLEGRVPYMTYPDPWRGPPKQPPEFLRPAPKPIPPASRYNGVSTTSPNGTRLGGTQRPLSKYPSSPSITAPVNLAQHKDDMTEELTPYSPYRLYGNPPHFNHFPFPSIYPTPYSHIPIRPTYPTTPTLPPMDTYSPTTPTTITSAPFLPPPANFTPPTPTSASIKSGQTVLRDKRSSQQPASPHQPQSAQQHANSQQQQQQQPIAFKVPSGKEGSLKHRILTRPEEGSRSSSLGTPAPLDLQKPTASEVPRRRLNASSTDLSPPPRSPKKLQTLNNNSIGPSFKKGQLIQLSNGELRRIEDMRTEDFVSSAERNSDLRLVDSTVVRLEEKPATGTAAITLSYNQRRTQVGPVINTVITVMESPLEHPFFVYGQGWASCRPDKTHQCYKLKVHQLQVGDIVVSLVAREKFNNPVLSRTTTIMTTATSTAMTVRPVNSVPRLHEDDHHLHHHQKPSTSISQQMQPINLHTKNHPQALLQPQPPQSLSPESLAAKKRRWSAPEICDAEEQNLIKRHRVE